MGRPLGCYKIPHASRTLVLVVDHQNGRSNHPRRAGIPGREDKLREYNYRRETATTYSSGGRGGQGVEGLKLSLNRKGRLQIRLANLSFSRGPLTSSLLTDYYPAPLFALFSLPRRRHPVENSKPLLFPSFSGARGRKRDAGNGGGWRLCVK